MVKELEKISFLMSEGSVSRVKKKITQICWRSQRWSKLIELSDTSPAGWATVQENLSNDLANDSDDKK